MHTHAGIIGINMATCIFCALQCLLSEPNIAVHIHDMMHT